MRFQKFDEQLSIDILACRNAKRIVVNFSRSDDLKIFFYGKLKYPANEFPILADVRFENAQ